jgi:hypothetical protein
MGSEGIPSPQTRQWSCRPIGLPEHFEIALKSQGQALAAFFGVGCSFTPLGMQIKF